MSNNPLSRRTRSVLLALARARRSRRTVRLRYLEAGAACVERPAEVLALAFDAPRWIVAAWCPDRCSLRVLDAARVSGARTLSKRCGPAPEGFDALDFSLHRLLDPGLRPVVVRMSLDHRTGLLLSTLMPSAQVTARKDGWSWSVRTSRPEVVRLLVASLGGGGAVDSRPPMAPTRGDTREKTAEARLLGLASWILEQSEPVTRKRIYEAFPADYRGAPAAAEKKFSRDKDALRRLGFNIEIVPLGKDDPGYSIDPRSCALPAIEFTPEEAALLWMAGTAALRLSRHPLREDLEAALRKLVVGARGLPPRAAPTDELSAEATPDDDKRLAKLVDAWERRRRVRVRYWRAAADEEVERDVDVYGWASRRGEWIFAGYCHLRQAVRVFYVSRVRAVKPVNGAKDAGYEIPATFDIRRWSRQQIWDYEVHPPIQAVVRLKGPLARIGKQLLPAAAFSTDTSGARVAKLEVRNLRGLVRQALAWGPDAELLEPEDGRAMARQILAAMADRSAP